MAGLTVICLALWLFVVKQKKRQIKDPSSRSPDLPSVKVTQDRDLPSEIQSAPGAISVSLRHATAAELPAPNINADEKQSSELMGTEIARS